MPESIQLVECPRDAWQGRSKLVPTALKTNYLQQLLAVGFHTLDAGSFVSPKAVPQLADTAEVLCGLDLRDTKTRLLVILANERGAEQVANHPYISYWGYPLSVSETFQQRNTRQSVSEGIELAKRLRHLADRSNAELVVYVSMGFGNPYGESYHPDQVLQLAGQLQKMNVPVVSLADTVGLATPDQIRSLVTQCRAEFPSIQWGVHLHGKPGGQPEKIAAAYEAGCRRFDGAIGGYGGCPFAEDELVGNINTQSLIDYLSEIYPDLSIDREQFNTCVQLAQTIFT
ncbi:MAG: hydroxymethylglutaryl-CoA lyase [Bacteroidetes bacterium]|nr:hydroxymethylglutaryl-CoA lyase [Bacteroidota bacterium]